MFTPIRKPNTSLSTRTQLLADELDRLGAERRKRNPMGMSEGFPQPIRKPPHPETRPQITVGGHRVFLDQKDYDSAQEAAFAALYQAQRRAKKLENRHGIPEVGGEIRPGDSGGFFIGDFDDGECKRNDCGQVDVTVTEDAVAYLHLHPPKKDGSYNRQNVKPSKEDWRSYRRKLIKNGVFVPGYILGPDGGVRMFHEKGPREGIQVLPAGTFSWDKLQ